MMSVTMSTVTSTAEDDPKSWFCEVCSRDIPLNELERHLVFHPTFMYPSLRDNSVLPLSEYRDSYNEIAAQLGKLFGKFREALNQVQPLVQNEQMDLVEVTSTIQEDNVSDDDHEIPEMNNNLIHTEDVQKTVQKDETQHNHDLDGPFKPKKFKTFVEAESDKSKTKKKVTSIQDVQKIVKKDETQHNLDLDGPSKPKKFKTFVEAESDKSKTKKKVASIQDVQKTEKKKKNKETKQTLNRDIATSSEIQKSDNIPDEIHKKKKKDLGHVTTSQKAHSSLKSKEAQNFKSSSKQQRLKNDDDEIPKKKKMSSFVMNSQNPFKSEDNKETIEWMIKKMKKLNMKIQDEKHFEKINKAMKASFKYRKYEIEKGMGIEDALISFPAMTDYRILKKEFERLKKADFKLLERKLRDDLTTETQRFTMKHYIPPIDIMAKAMQDSRRSTNADLQRDFEMLCLGYEKTHGKFNSKLFKHRNNEKDFDFARALVTPAIDIVGDLSSDSKKITLYCEEQRICQVPNFYEAIMCIYALYWIFNLCYEKGAKPLFEHFDQLIGE